MQTAPRLETTVLPGHRVEVSAPELPDALHAATAQQVACVLFVSNDVGFRGVPRLPLVILDDLLKP